MGGILGLVTSFGLVSGAGQLEAQVVYYETPKGMIVVVDQSQFSDEPIVVVMKPVSWPTIDALIVIREGALSVDGVERALSLAQGTLDRWGVDGGCPDLVLSLGGVDPDPNYRGRAAALVPLIEKQGARSRDLVAEMGEHVLAPPPELRALGATRMRGLAHVSFSIQPVEPSQDVLPEAGSAGALGGDSERY